MAKKKKDPEKDPEKDPKKAQKSIYLNTSMWGKIQARADKEKRSLNNVIEIVLEKEFV
jgi:hypothetical protein